MSKNIKPLNEEGRLHGYQDRYWEDGKTSYKCHCINGRVVGYEEDHYEKKIMKS